MCVCACVCASKYKMCEHHQTDRRPHMQLSVLRKYNIKLFNRNTLTKQMKCKVTAITATTATVRATATITIKATKALNVLT